MTSDSFLLLFIACQVRVAYDIDVSSKMREGWVGMVVVVLN